ncbi:MAG: hypothetical protein DSM106950_25620 [Stigonema ocellatum SAG 48.90 = DSM 106950]|nr:hypothetical protein [Stigonema ocellatum SAG 48.90 = DSM 106950]
MLTLKRKNIIFIVFILLGFGYFNAMSNLAMDEFFKSEIALIPVQLIAIIYTTYLRWNRPKHSVKPDN